MTSMSKDEYGGKHERAIDCERRAMGKGEDGRLLKSQETVKAEEDWPELSMTEKYVSEDGRKIQRTRKKQKKSKRWKRKQRGRKGAGKSMKDLE